MKISPSILSVPENKLDDAISLLEKLHTPYLHLDVMDGKFVPNQTYDFDKVKAIHDKTSIKLDTHLMIDCPENTIDEYIATGSSIITIHVEATTKVKEILKKLKANNIKCGLSIKPNTSVDEIKEYLCDLDLVLVMSVEPGFGGQKFIESSLEKIKSLNDLRKQNNYHYLIEVDGGINLDNASKVKEAGADMIVVGTFLMNSSDISTTYKELNKI